MKLWTGIVTAKVTEAAAFYRDLFGFDVIYRGDDDWFVLLEKDGQELGFMLPRRPEQAPAFRAPYSGDGLWLVLDVDDVRTERERLGSAGVVIEVELRREPWGDHHFVVRDPAGIALDIVERRTQKD